jgi:hypothetical protein
VEELVGLRLLDHESARSRPNRFEDVPIDPEGREDHDTITRERTRAIAIWEPHLLDRLDTAREQRGFTLLKSFTLLEPAGQRKHCDEVGCLQRPRA